MFKEVFTDFVLIERITWEVIVDVIIGRLKVWGLSLADLRVQCYDGSSNMGIYSHSAAHLAVVSACKIQAFKNTESCIGEIARFSKFSAATLRQGTGHSDSCHSRKEAEGCLLHSLDSVHWFVCCLLRAPSCCSHCSAGHIMPKLVQGPWNRLDLGWRNPITKANKVLYHLESFSFLVCFKICFIVP